MAKRDYYETRISTDFPKEILKGLPAPRNCHPDRNLATEAEVKFKELSEAYEVLSDPENVHLIDMAMKHSRVVWEVLVVSRG